MYSFNKELAYNSEYNENIQIKRFNIFNTCCTTAPNVVIVVLCTTWEILSKEFYIRLFDNM